MELSLPDRGEMAQNLYALLLAHLEDEAAFNYLVDIITEDDLRGTLVAAVDFAVDLGILACGTEELTRAIRAAAAAE